MIHLLWLIPICLLFWAIVHGGNRKQMPPVEPTTCKRGEAIE